VGRGGIVGKPLGGGGKCSGPPTVQILRPLMARKGIVFAAPRQPGTTAKPPTNLRSLDKIVRRARANGARIRNLRESCCRNRLGYDFGPQKTVRLTCNTTAPDMLTFFRGGSQAGLAQVAPRGRGLGQGWSPRGARGGILGKPIEGVAKCSGPPPFQILRPLLARKGMVCVNRLL
jgi:hypothetical protein